MQLLNSEQLRLLSRFARQITLVGDHDHISQNRTFFHGSVDGLEQELGLSAIEIARKTCVPIFGLNAATGLVARQYKYSNLLFARAVKTLARKSLASCTAFYFGGNAVHVK